MKPVTIYDTTLRDGMQGIEVNFTLADKIDIAHKLDDLNIDYIEGGFPLSNEKEMAFFEKVKKENFNHAKIVAFGSTRRPGKKTDQDAHMQALLNAETPAVIIVGKAWDAHVKDVLHTTLEENLAMIYDSITYFKKEGRETFLDLEHFFDGYKTNPEYGLKILKTATEAGADALVLCDTNGGILPSEVTTILNELPQESLNPLGVHFHNDTGTAVANSLIAIENGCVQVQGTINGWGERCGNANLCVIAPNVALKMKRQVNIKYKLQHLTSLSRYVFEKANIIPDKRQPYVGQAALSHKAGQHADVITKAPHLMEHIDGSLVGNERRIILSELAGKSTIVRKLTKYGKFEKNSEIVAKLIKKLKQKENDGYEYEVAEASFDLIIRKAMKKYKKLVELSNYHLESFKTGEATSKTVGRIFLVTGGKVVMGVGTGGGPVETLDIALRDALDHFFPFMKKISLIDYKVRVLNPEEAAAAKVRVFITSTDNTRSWDTVGVSENIVEASWTALVDSMEYYYNNYVEEK